MKKLKRHELDFDPAYTYVQDVLNKANVLSCELLKSVNFKKGLFFTFLPTSSAIENIYKFSSGGITACLSDEIAQYILTKLNSNINLRCIIDDVLRDPKDRNINSFQTLILEYENEIYYLIDQKKTTFQTIVKCMQETNAIWHSLCILTEANLDDATEKKLTLEKIKEICVMTKLVMIGAYDGEGYIFWEPSPQS